MTPGTSRNVFVRLLGLLRPYRARIVLGLVLLMASMPGEVFPAFAWMYVVDGLIKPEPGRIVTVVHWVVSFDGAIVSKIGLLVSTLVWMTAVYVVFEAIETLSGVVLQRTAEAFIRDLRQRMYARLQGQSLSWLQRQRTGDLMSRALGDVDELRSFIVGGIDVVVGEGLLWLITVAIVMAIDWRVAGASLLPLVVVYLMLRVFNRRVGPVYRAARESQGGWRLDCRRIWAAWW